MSNANDAEVHELEPLPDDPAGSPGLPAVPPTAAPGTAAPGSRAPQTIEKAPLVLQQAALILLVSTLLPWLVPQGFEVHRLIAKAVVLLGGWIAYCAVEHAHGIATPLDALGKKHKLALPIAASVVLLIGVGLARLAPEWQGFIEVAALAVGILAWCQVHGYARGGKFNPVWALIIPMFGLAAVVNIVVVLFLDVDGLSKVLAIVGSLGVASAGGLAGYTLVIAMKDAKAHGELRKRAASEARMADRKAKRGDSGGGAAPQG